MVRYTSDSTTTSDLTNQMETWEVDSEFTDGPTGDKEIEYITSDWNNYLGYYFNIPELRAAIDAKATWTVGKGFQADPETTFILDTIRGWGKDTFNTILENMIRTYHIIGDSYAEIIRDDDGEFINLKPLDPSVMKIVADEKGIIIRYEQVNKIATKDNIKFKPEDIFHLARNRVADEIHGRSIIKPIENIIKYRNQAMDDWDTALHRNIHPLRLWKIDTDDTTKIGNFKNQVHDAFKNKGEHMFMPKDVAEHELATIPGSATLNPLQWIDTLNSYFFQAVGVPDIILGNSKALTEASAKIAYLAFQQNVEEEQLFIEEQVGIQLGLLINLEFPASLENELLSDKKKDGNTPFQPNETTAGRGQ